MLSVTEPVTDSKKASTITISKTYELVDRTKESEIINTSLPIKTIIKDIYDKPKECLEDGTERLPKFTKTQNISVHYQTKKTIKTKTILVTTKNVRENDVISKKTLVTNKIISHKLVHYNDKNYVVAYTEFNTVPVLFIFDESNKESVIQKAWHYRNMGGYIAHKINIQDDEKELYLHNFVMGKMTFEGKGQHHTIDHINRIGRDNRLENLINKTQSQQNKNQKKRQRDIILPLDSGIDANDIPKNIWYMNPTSTHGDRFCLQIKGLPKETYKNGQFIWKSTSKSDISLKSKLEQTILKLKETRNKHPEIKDNTCTEEKDEEKRKTLTQSFNDIITISGYPDKIIKRNLVDFTSDITHIDLTENECEVAKNQLVLQNSGKKTQNNLPEKGGVSKSDIPKYCYYVPASESRGDKFVIERHPKLVETGKKQLCTPESKLISTKEKFDILLEYLDCLEKDIPIVKKETPKGKRGQFCEKEAPRKKITTITETIITPLPPKTIQDEPKKVYISDTSTLDENDKNNIPRYVYYKPTDKEHGTYWFIKDHPELMSRNIKIKCSRTSALLSDKEKYDEILIHLEALDKNQPFVSFPTIRASKNSIHKEKSTKSIPPNWNLEENPIPEYLYYRHCDNKRGDTWIIKGHPKQEKAMITTTTSKEKTTIEKYNEAMNIIQSFA